MTTAVLMIAHGSRHEEANADLFYLAGELKQAGEYPVVECAFLELARPTIDEGGAACVATGAGQVILLPYFLSAGVHVRRDLSAHRDRLAARFPDVDFYLAEPLGRHPQLRDVVIDRAREAAKTR